MIQTVNATFFACTFLSAANATQVKFQCSCRVAEFSMYSNLKTAKGSDTLSNQRFSGFDEQHSSITTLSCSSGSYSQSSRQMVMMARKLEKKHDTS